MTPEQKARKVAEEIAKQIVADDFLDRTVHEAEDEIADALTKAILQFAQEQESEAVRELMAGLEPFAVAANNVVAYVGDETMARVEGKMAEYTGITYEHLRKAAALIAKHSRKGPNP